MMEAQDVLPSATRRVKLMVDKDGTPCYPSVTSPESFRQNALGVLPPRDVIPVVFVPGIMGTNLKLKDKDGTPAWTPPNTTREKLSELKKAIFLEPSQRQALFDPTNTVVSYDGPCEVRSDVFWLDTAEARRRGWGSLHASSYLQFLQQLEVSLNDQYTRPGLSEAQGNHLLPEIGLLSHLKGGPARTEGYRGRAWNAKPNYAKYAQEAMAAWHAEPPALSQAQIQRLDDYYYPVYAYGYNWLRSNEDSAAGLWHFVAERIEAFYARSAYFRFTGKILLVTHSMGGLVGRRAAQLRPDKVLGAVHGVCPVAGAPVVYRRFRAGTEHGAFNIGEWGFAKVIGDDAEAITPELACAPGALELLPTRHYPPGWLRFTQERGMFAQTEVLYRLPEADPYKEIYGKTTDECWWGMIDPALIDPAGLIAERGKGKKTPAEVSRAAVRAARNFHDKLNDYVHPNTYGFYGIDDDKHRAFGHVTWQFNYGKDLPRDILSRKDVGRGPKGSVDVPMGEDIPTGKTAWVSKTNVWLLNEKNRAGDGTVPMDSGMVLERFVGKPDKVFRIDRADHQTAFDTQQGLWATLYGIARIVQDAPPVDL